MHSQEQCMLPPSGVFRTISLLESRQIAQKYTFESFFRQV